MSKVYEPKVVRMAALLAIILSVVPKFSAIISTMPTAIIGGISFILYGMISAIGVRNIVENKVDLSKSRNLIIAAVIFVSGLGFKDGLTFSVFGTSVTLTSLAIAAIAGIVLNAVLPGNKYVFDENAIENEIHHKAQPCKVKEQTVSVLLLNVIFTDVTLVESYFY